MDAVPEVVKQTLQDPKNFPWLSEEDDYDPQKEAALVASMNKQAEKAAEYASINSGVGAYRTWGMDAPNAVLGANPMEVVNTLDVIAQELKSYGQHMGIGGVLKKDIDSGLIDISKIQDMQRGDFRDRYAPDWSASKEVKSWDIQNFLGMIDRKFFEGKDDVDLRESSLMTKMVKDEQGNMVPLASLLTMKNMGGATLQEVIIRIESGLSLTGDANTKLIATKRRSDEELYEIDRFNLPLMNIPGR